ncbi:MAG TPA: hypothetical protein VER35_02795 [Candidatus Limnocylindrales bacterium]|nr:hypothetical protein [Candidatus Limnocylindrales bacterium]
MGVNEDVLKEIFEERAQYLVNVDEVMLEMYDEQNSRKTRGIPYSGVGTIDMVQKIRVVDQLFESKEYQTYIQLTRPEEITKRKFHPLSPRKLRDNELKDFESIGQN